MNAVVEFIRGLPPITRALFISNASVVAGITLGLLNGSRLALVWGLVIHRPIPNVYRLGTSLVLGSGGIKALVNLYYLHMFCRDIELKKMHNDPVQMVEYIGVVLCPILVLSYVFGVYGLFEPLMNAIIYTWSHDHPDTIMSLMFGIQLKAPLMPIACLFTDIFLGGSVYAGLPSLMGILGGHFYYFLHTIYPQASGGKSVLNSSKKNNKKPSSSSWWWPGGGRGRGRRLGSG